MRCIDCDSDFVRQHGSVSVESVSLGRISVDNVDYMECSGCGELLLPPPTIKTIEKTKKEKINYLIGKLPGDDLIIATEAAEILDRTKQAFSKNKRIKRGFIYSTTISGRTHYSRKSVELFKETGDGRFLLNDTQSETKYIVLNYGLSSDDQFAEEISGDDNVISWLETTNNGALYND